MGILDSALQSPDGFDPQTQGILKAAFALMAAGAPTRVPTGIGEALGQAGSAGIDAFEAAKKAKVDEALKAIQLKKAQNDLEMQQQIESGGVLNTNDPDKLEAIGTRLALAGHPGGAGIINAAEKMRQKKQAAERLKSLQSTVAPDPQEVAQSADQGTPLPGGGGLFAPLMNSPYVGEDARRLQDQLDKAGPGANPDDYLKRLDALAAAHRAAQEKENDRILRESLAGKSEHVIQDRASPTGWSYEDTRTGKRTLGAPPPSAAAATNVSDVIPSEHRDLHGDDYLATLPPGMANVVKSIGTGKTSLNDASMRYGNRDAMKARVLQAYPSWTGNVFKNRQEFENPNGKTQQNITAIGTALAHAGTVYDLVTALDNKDIRLVNQAVNKARTELGDPRINNAQTAIQAFGNEMMRVFRQVQASEQETKDWESRFNAEKNSPRQLQGALQTGVKLLEGRLREVNETWKRTVDPNSDYPVLSPAAKTSLSKIGIVGEGIPISPNGATSKIRKYNPTTGKLE